MTPTKLLIIVVALAVIANARVAVAPGWVVPVPALLIVVALAVLAAIAAVLARRVRDENAPQPRPSAPREPAAPEAAR